MSSTYGDAYDRNMRYVTLNISLTRIVDRVQQPQHPAPIQRYPHARRETVKLARLIPLCAAVTISACDGTAPSDGLTDEAILGDVAASAGDAIASALHSIAGNATAAALPGSSGPAGTAALTGGSVDVERSRVCYDAADREVTGCTPLSAVRKIVTSLTVDGTRSGSHTTKRGVTVNWTGAVHRVASDTLRRNFAGDAEVSRTHDGIAVAHDTTTFSDGSGTRVVSEAASDSVRGVTWNVPRSTNPFPVAGYIVRVDTVRVVATRDGETREREVVWTIRVDFPADAQGNVVLQINGKTCNLNLVTRRVSNCES